MTVVKRSYEYKYAVFGDLLHEVVYDRLEEQHKKIIDIWLNGILNGKLVHISTLRMKFAFSDVEDYFPNVYEELATVMDLVEEHFAQDHVITLDSPDTLERLEDAFNEWKSLVAVRMGNYN